MRGSHGAGRLDHHRGCHAGILRRMCAAAPQRGGASGSCLVRAMVDADLRIDRIYHPNTGDDVAARSRRYPRLLDMQLAMEFVEDDACGVELAHPPPGSALPSATVPIQDSDPALSGFDLVAFEMKSLQAFEAFADGAIAWR